MTVLYIDVVAVIREIVYHLNKYLTRYSNLLCCFQFGQHDFQGLPDFITMQMKNVIFPLLAHPQLSVRENAIKAFSSYLARCEFQVSVYCVVSENTSLYSRVYLTEQIIDYVHVCCIRSIRFGYILSSDFVGRIDIFQRCHYSAV